jgi:acetyl-CoA acetyltransferase
VSWPLRDQTAIVGVGETAYTRAGATNRSELSLACEAIIDAVTDAGLDLDQVDGLCTYEFDRVPPRSVAQALGLERVSFACLAAGGGTSTTGVVQHAAAAVHGHVAEVVVCYRSICQGGAGRYGRAEQSTGRPAEAPSDGRWGFMVPFGVMVPAHWFALDARRHMALYGTRSEHFGAIAVAAYNHAQRNPRAVMNGRPLTLEAHQASRMIVDPYHLYDCCQESDGAAAAVVTSTERARSLPHPPALIAGVAQVMTRGDGPDMHSRPEEFWSSAAMEPCATELYRRAGIGPESVDVVQIYENFTGQVLMAIEDFGFCPRGDGGPFVADGALDWATGSLPFNTSGGNLAEGYIHGFNLVVEGVRQIRGDSTAQVRDVEHCLVVSAPSAPPGGAMILRRQA